MTPLRRSFAALLLSAAWLLPVVRGEWALPPVDGELSGQFAATKLPGAPVLRWTAKLRSGDDGGRQAQVVMEGDGLRLRAEVWLDPAGNGRWSIAGGELEAARCFAVVAPELGAALAGVTASGRLELSGGGELRAGRATGVVKLAWRDGGLWHEAQGWSLEGLSLEGEFAVDSAGGAALLTSATPCAIKVRTIRSPRFGARNFSTHAMLKAERRLTLSDTRIEVAGGEVTVAECTWPLSPLAIEARLRIRSVGLQDIAAFVPAGLADARGRISGEVGVAWSEAQGFQLGSGTLDVTAEEPAMVRLAASPGFLTKRVPKTFELIPGLGRLFKAENPAYADLSAIELGQGDLKVESLSVRLTPEGDERGRTASVLMTARPAKPTSAIGLVTFEVNVAGPLTQALRLGLNQSFSIEMR